MKAIMMFIVLVMFLTLGMVRQASVGQSAQIIQKVNSVSNAAAHASVDVAVQSLNNSGPAKWLAGDAATLAKAAYSNPALNVSSQVLSVGQQSTSKAITLTVKTQSTGRIKWSKQYTVALTLAYVTNMASVNAGRTVYDYLGTNDTGSFNVIAMWVPGELKTYKSTGN